MPTLQEQILTVQSLPGHGFTDEDRQLLQGLWLRVDQETIDGINTALEASGCRMRVRGRLDTEGNVWLPSSLLTDTTAGRSFHCVRATLMEADIVEDGDITWPEPPTEE